MKITDLPGELQLPFILALQIDGYGTSQSVDVIKYLPVNTFSKACSILLSLETARWIKLLRPHGNPPDPNMLSLKVYGTEIAIDRHVMNEYGELIPVKAMLTHKVLNKIRALSNLGETGRLFIARPTRPD